MKLAGLTHGGAVSLSLASALKKSEGCRSFGLCGECVILAFAVNIPNRQACALFDAQQGKDESGSQLFNI